MIDGSNIVACRHCGVGVISEEIERHRCGYAMVDGNSVWFRTKGGWKKREFPASVMARVKGKLGSEGLPPIFNTQNKHPENQQCSLLYTV
jgi:hypothetical protein